LAFFAPFATARNPTGVTRTLSVAAQACPYGIGGRQAFLGFF